LKKAAFSIQTLLSGIKFAGIKNNPVLAPAERNIYSFLEFRRNDIFLMPFLRNSIKIGKFLAINILFLRNFLGFSSRANAVPLSNEVSGQNNFMNKFFENLRGLRGILIFSR
jgi:hypothetical protein